jgi:hypothetical protein
MFAKGTIAGVVGFAGLLLALALAVSANALTAKKPPPPPEVRISGGGDVREGKRVKFKVKLSEAPTEKVVVRFYTVKGSATAGSDYAGRNGKLTFLPGDATGGFSVQTKQDGEDERRETFKAKIQSNTATVKDGADGATIVDDDDRRANPETPKPGEQPQPHLPTLSVIDVIMSESTGLSNSAALDVILSAPSATPVTVDYTTADGTAFFPADYATTAGTLTFVPGDTFETVVVPVVSDPVPESNETFTFNMSNPSGATLADAQAVVTLIDDD